MARYIVKVEPKPTDRVYITFPNNQGKKEYLIQDDTTIELNREPKELTIRRESTWYHSFTSWRCKYVTVTSSDSGKELYFPVFREISSERAIKENSAKLPQDDSSEERKECLLNNHKVQEAIGQQGKGAFFDEIARTAVLKITAKLPQDDSSEEREECLLNNHKVREAIGQQGKGAFVEETARTTVLKITESEVSAIPGTDAKPIIRETLPQKSSTRNYILYFILRIIGIFPEQLLLTHKAGLPGFVRGRNFFELPKNLWFETCKVIEMVYTVGKIGAQTIFRRLWNFRRKWKKIDDIRNVFWFPSKKAAYISQNWRKDELFANLFLNGCNPLMIKRYAEDQKKIPMETLEKVYPDIKENIQNGSIYVVDYEILDDLAESMVMKSPKFLAAPIVLLHQTEEELKPIAIQLNQKAGEDHPVFTPQDKPEAWVLAKIWVRNSDFYYHELVSHLLRTHLMGELFFLGSYSLADQHPLSRILRACGRYTLPINVTARNTLINEGGFFMQYTAIGNKLWEVLRRAAKEMTYESLCLPDSVKHRGIENLKNFHYRDDGLAIWDSIYTFVRGVVNRWYKDDKDIQNDPELQDMVSFINKHGCLQDPGFPTSLETREEAMKYITMIMFTCSAQHAAMNHGQYDIYAWMPNGPTTMRRPQPTDKNVTEEHIMETLPDINTTLQGMQVARFLSQDPYDFVPLGEYPEEVAFERTMRNLILNFQSKLKEIGENIKRRSAFKDFPYEYLNPAGIENSITI